MRILLTGAGGQLGRQFLRTATEDTVIAAYHATAPPGWKGAAMALDLSAPTTFEGAVQSVRPDWVVHGAAMTNVDACEKDPAAARRINGEATGELAAAARSAGARFLFVSTDYVFDGAAGPYSEADAAGPLQEYGRSKLEGERLARAADPDAVIARTAIVYGPDKPNFVTWLVTELSAGRTVRIVSDQWVTPTHTKDLSEQILALLHTDAKGTFHTAGAEGCSRLEMAHQVADVFGLPRKLIVPTTSAELAWVARRPRDSRLSTSKMAKLKRPFGLQQALQELKLGMGR